MITKYGVLIGRFQPLHNGHLSLLRFGLSQVETMIIVLGSATSARTVKNPWSADERIEMINQSVTDDERKRLRFVKASDYLYNDNLWLTSVQQKIDEVTDGCDEDISLIGYEKDKSSFYLSLFPQWKFLGAGNSFIHKIDATKIRDLYFKCDLVGIQSLVPGPVFNKLKKDMMSDMITPNESFMDLKEEFEHYVDYKNRWKGAPYAPIHQTVDAVVMQSGHVLVVRRKCRPGKGLLALPGGFLHESEFIVKGCTRELKEETGISLSQTELEKLIVAEKRFDHPERSLRGRTITDVFCFNLGMGKLHRVKGMDDADKAFWMPFNEALSNEQMFFEDHAHIIRHFIMK